MKKLFFTLFACLLVGASFAQVNCSQLQAVIGYNANGTLVYFNNNSTNANVPYIYDDASWSFGDGGTSTSNNPSHTYAAPGNYLVHMINHWIDSTNNNVVCSDSTSVMITVTSGNPASNEISGSIHWDSTAVMQASFKVWLIVHDSAANTLTAVDSLTTGGVWNASYQFNNHPAGVYLTKAAMQTGGTTLPASLLPTYHTSSLYWNSADPIVHAGGTTSNKYIWMITGTAPSGPGFIGGNISLGANKGTATGVPGIMVAVRDAMNNPVTITYTDANGDYSFDDLPLGTYNIYPESINYFTTPSAALTITSSQASITAVDFKQTATEIKPKTTGIANVAGKEFFTLYPNPSEGNLQINWKNTANGTAQIAVMDISGRTVLTTAVSMNKSAYLNLGSLQQGVYFVNIISEGVRHTEKIILQ
jgi:hypothetical protein